MAVPQDLLADVSLLGDCSPDEVAELGNRLSLREIDPDDMLMREGESATDFALLLTGHAVITRKVGDQLEHLGEAGPGAILGELALLREGPRSATVTARTPCTVAVGDVTDLDYLLHLPGVHDQVRDLASARLARDVQPVATTARDGTALLLRPLLSSDRAGYTAALAGMSTDSLRNRFFVAGQPTSRMIDYLVQVNFVDHFVWVALLADDPAVGISTGRYVRSREDPAEAEIALAVVDAYQARGVGRLMLGAIGAAAAAAGVERLVAEIQVDNTSVRALLERAGATFSLSEPGVVEVALTPAGAAGLIDPALADALENSSREIVTAAGLALT